MFNDEDDLDAYLLNQCVMGGSYSVYEDYDACDDDLENTNSNKLIGEADIMRQIEANPMYAIRKHLSDKKYVKFAMLCDFRVYNMLSDEFKNDNEIIDSYILKTLPDWRISTGKAPCTDYCTQWNKNKFNPTWRPPTQNLFSSFIKNFQERSIKISKTHDLGDYWVIGGKRDVVDELVKLDKLYLLNMVDESLRRDEKFMLEMCRIHPCAINATLILTDELVRVVILQSMFRLLNEKNGEDKDKCNFYWISTGDHVYFGSFYNFIVNNSFIVDYLNKNEELCKKCLFYCGELIENVKKKSSEFTLIALETHIESCVSGSLSEYNYTILRTNPQARNHHWRVNVYTVDDVLGNYKPIAKVAVFDVNFKFR